MHRKTATNATEQQREDRHHDVKRQHLLLFLLTVLGKRLKLLLLGLLSSAFACSDHRCVCALIVDVGRRGRKRRRGKRETGQEEARQRAGKLRRQQLENPGEAMKTSCCSIWKQHRGARVRERRGSLGHLIVVSSPSRVEGLFCYWLIRSCCACVVPSVVVYLLYPVVVCFDRIQGYL